MDFLKNVTGKVVSGVVALAVIAGGSSWWRTDPAMREMLLNGAGKIASWLGIVLLIPWATFFIVSKVARMESNAAGAALIAGYTILETVLLAWLFQWHMPSATAWTFLLVGGLFAGVYNLFTCDWIAEKVVG
jgi:FtsH-binding integral membrane protein